MATKKTTKRAVKKSGIKRVKRRTEAARLPEHHDEFGLPGNVTSGLADATIQHITEVTEDPVPPTPRKKAAPKQ